MVLSSFGDEDTKNAFVGFFELGGFGPTNSGNVGSFDFIASDDVLPVDTKNAVDFRDFGGVGSINSGKVGALELIFDPSGDVGPVDTKKVVAFLNFGGVGRDV